VKKAFSEEALGAKGEGKGSHEVDKAGNMNGAESR